MRYWFFCTAELSSWGWHTVTCCFFLIPRLLQREYDQLKEQHGQRGASTVGQWESETSFSHPDEADLLAEAKLLRQHKGRLEARMHILEEHNKQLESQLHRLRQLLHQVLSHLHHLFLEASGWVKCIHSHTKIGVSQKKRNQDRPVVLLYFTRQLQGDLFERFSNCHNEKSICRQRLLQF